MKTKNPTAARSNAAPECFVPRTILVPVDFSDSNIPALRHASFMAKAYDAELRVLHVIEPPPYPEFGYSHLAVKEVKLRTFARGKLEDLTASPVLKGVKKVTLVIRYGRASAEIVDEAADCEADLLVISTHGRSGLMHLVMGSTAEKIVRTAQCPVLVVK